MTNRPDWTEQTTCEADHARFHRICCCIADGEDPAAACSVPAATTPAVTPAITASPAATTTAATTTAAPAATAPTATTATAPAATDESGSSGGPTSDIIETDSATTSLPTVPGDVPGDHDSIASPSISPTRPVADDAADSSASDDSEGGGGAVVAVVVILLLAAVGVVAVYLNRRQEGTPDISKRPAMYLPPGNMVINTR